MARPPTPFNLQQLTQKAAATLLGVTERALRDWELAGTGIPRNPDGSYPGPQLVAWWVARCAGTSPDDLDLDEQRARLAKWQADKAEQDVELRAGRLLDADQVVAWVADMIATVKSRLVQIPNAIAANFEKKQGAIVAAESRRLIDEALAELVTIGGGSAAGAVEPLEAGADADRKPMGRRISQAQ